MDMMMMNEQSQRGPHFEPMQPLPIAEYPVALEFYLQIDRTCVLTSVPDAYSSLSSEYLLYEDVFVPWCSTGAVSFYRSFRQRQTENFVRSLPLPATFLSRLFPDGNHEHASCLSINTGAIFSSSSTSIHQRLSSDSQLSRGND